jgi:competence transcription factor ComK
MIAICTFCHVHCLQIETSPKKFLKVKKEAVKFVGKMTFKLKFEFNSFILSTNNMCYYKIKFGKVLNLFDIFN